MSEWVKIGEHHHKKFGPLLVIAFPEEGEDKFDAYLEFIQCDVEGNPDLAERYCKLILKSSSLVEIEAELKRIVKSWVM